MRRSRGPQLPGGAHGGPLQVADGDEALRYVRSFRAFGPAGGGAGCFARSARREREPRSGEQTRARACTRAGPWSWPWAGRARAWTRALWQQIGSGQGLTRGLLGRLVARGWRADGVLWISSMDAWYGCILRGNDMTPASARGIPHSSTYTAPITVWAVARPLRIVIIFTE